MVMGPWKPYITKMNLKSGSKVNYDFDGFFKEIWIDAQVRNKNIIIGWIHSIDSNLDFVLIFMHVFVFAIFQNLLNFTYLVTQPSDGQWGSSNTSGRYRGMIGALHQKEVDIGILTD